MLLVFQQQVQQQQQQHEQLMLLQHQKEELQQLVLLQQQQEEQICAQPLPGLGSRCKQICAQPLPRLGSRCSAFQNLLHLPLHPPLQETVGRILPATGPVLMPMEMATDMGNYFSELAYTTPVAR
jgi:hypothetical protein